MKKIKNEQTEKLKSELSGLFTAVAFSAAAAAILITSAAAFFLVSADVSPIFNYTEEGMKRLIILTSLCSIILSLLFILIAGLIYVKPFCRLIYAMDRLASGDYNAHMANGKFFGKLSVMKKITDIFDKMASELRNTEVLRSDFINNFSHEFKTPIVSVTGFARLLKKGGLSHEQAMEYIDIIEEESMRLSHMATNVLDLTKIENQTILTDVASFNLSEQIRSCVLLLENKWSRKHIDMQVYIDEYFICANEDLLKHIWINLIDNAIKFSPEHGTIKIVITQNVMHLYVSISNTGKTIPPGSIGKIFDKFYRADESHSSQGNGIGLAIVKRVAELHQGTVSVKSQDGTTTFTVMLPKYQ